MLFIKDRNIRRWIYRYTIHITPFNTIKEIYVLNGKMFWRICSSNKLDSKFTEYSSSDKSGDESFDKVLSEKYKRIKSFSFRLRNFFFPLESFS